MPSHIPLKTITITSLWIHASRHIIVNTDDEHMDRKILCGKGSLTHLLQSSNASHISMKNSLSQIGCWTFTCWNKLLFFIFSEVLASQKLSTEAIRIEQCMWLDCSSCELWLLATDNSVTALSFYDSRLVKMMEFPGSKNKHRQTAVREPFDDPCMRSKSQTNTLFSKSGKGAIHL